MNFENIEFQQKKIIDSIKVTKSDPCDLNQEIGILKEIQKYDEEFIDYALPVLGAKIKRFSDSIDITHPDLKNLFFGQLTCQDEGKFGKVLTDYFLLISFLKSNSLDNSLLVSIRKSIKDNAYYGLLNKSIESPLNNNLNIRFMKSQKDVDTMREKKRVQSVYLNQNYHGSQSHWDCFPENCLIYQRFNNIYEKDLEKLKVRKNQFSDFGLICMAEEIQKSIFNIECESKDQSYFGFNKVKLDNLAVLLAKMSGYEFIEHQQTLAGSEFFVKINQEIQDACISFVNKKPMPTDKEVSYQPKAYTIFELNEVISLDIAKLIDYLDNFPDLNGKMLFDHFRVIVPSIGFLNKFQMDPYRGRDIHGNYVVFEDVNACKKMLDIWLLKNKNLVGALVGERDGSHYFISYFF